MFATLAHFIHSKKKLREFPVPSRDVTTKLSLGGNNDVITELFLPRGSLVSDIPAGDLKLRNLFLRCTHASRDPDTKSSSYPNPPSLGVSTLVGSLWVGVQLMVRHLVDLQLCTIHSLHFLYFSYPNHSSKVGLGISDKK